MSMWGFVANFALPPPMILTALLVLPTPRVVRTGLLWFTRSFLFAPTFGNSSVRLVHFMLCITGAMCIATAIDTARTRAPGIEETPDTRISMLGYKWRQERNFWISTLTFILWAMLYRLLHVMMHLDAVTLRVAEVERYAGLTADQEVPKNAKVGGSIEASAPPLTGRKSTFTEKKAM